MATERMLVVDEMLGKPSEISPMLFVGLGGAGCRMVVRIARHLGRRPDFDEKYRSLVKFALLDTNIADLEAFREHADETFLVSDFEKEQYAGLASGKMFLEPDDYFTQWVPQTYRFRAGDTAGAGQIRIESRLGCYYQMKHKDLVPRMRALLEELKSHEHGHRRLDTPEIKIVICYSVAGGTGSGAHLPLAYMLRDQARAVGRPTLLGVAILPSVFEDKTGSNKDGTFANGYAALKETEHLMKLGAPDSRFYPEEGLTFHYDPSDESRRTVRQRPFEFLYVIDKPESFTVEDVVGAASDALYLQLFSPLFNVQMGDYDNYTQHQRFLVPHDFEEKGIVGFTTFYGSYGAAVLLVPVEGLVRYCARAQALVLMRRSFLGDIPGEPAYHPLQLDSQRFYEVTLDDDDERPVRVADFHAREKVQRDILMDRLYQKRVRLLAACEREYGVVGRFFTMFRHGHRVGEIPTIEGGYAPDADDEKLARDALRKSGMAFSMGGVILPAIGGRRPRSMPGLLAEARKQIERYAEESAPSSATELTGAGWKERFRGLTEDYRNQGMRVLKRGFRAGGVRYPGFEDLLELEFMKQVGEVDLAAKRYAVLCLLDEIDGMNLEPPESPAEFQIDVPDGKRVKERDAQGVIDILREQAVERAFTAVRIAFLEDIQVFKEHLEGFARVQRIMDQGFAELERQKSRQLEDLRKKGEESANRYILDGEALQIENGRRMWDFYFSDEVATDPDVGLGDRRVRQILNDTVVDLSRTSGQSTGATLEKLYDALFDHVARKLCVKIDGDPSITDPARRGGLTLARALQLEVEYRALYLSNQEAVQEEGEKAIRRILAEYRALPPEEHLDFTDRLHQDYLRDKVKRLVMEKAGLLCMYDESRDLQGGVRPDRILLAAIDEDLRGTPVDEALRGADIPDLRWVTHGWHDPQEVVFYRAILNVPLYVFGRMDEMKDYYYRFRNLARRSKVLHIDKNWEETLPDLDPDTAQEKHRQARVRAHIINFAALLKMRPAGMDHAPIVARKGTYYLRDPDAPGSERLPGDQESGFARLGRTLAEAVENLPEVLESQQVKYLPYQQVLTGVRQGLAPKVLMDIVDLPLQWRRTRDELRTQYGANPSAVQSERLKDLTTAFSRLVEALLSLLAELRDLEKERQAMEEDIELSVQGIDPRDLALSLRQSISILERFQETWQAMEDPEVNREIPRHFSAIFSPMTPEELDQRFEHLKRGVRHTLTKG